MQDSQIKMSLEFSEDSGDFCKIDTSYLQVVVENRVLPFVPLDICGEAEPILCTHVLSRRGCRGLRARCAEPTRHPARGGHDLCSSNRNPPHND